MCDDSTLWYCMTTGYYPSTTNASFSNASFVCVIDSGNPFSMSDCVTSTLTFAIYLEPQCANITSPIFSSSTTQGSTTVTSSQIIISTVTTEGIMTSVDTTNLPTFTGTSGPGPSASALSSHSTPEWLTPLWTTILGSVAAAAIIWFFRRYISSRLPYCWRREGQPDDQFLWCIIDQIPCTVGIGLANATGEPRFRTSQAWSFSSMYFSLGSAHCSALYLFLHIELVLRVELAFLLFYARLLLI